jgi:glycosyltransferase involved in cell wall biosynthesis
MSPRVSILLPVYNCRPFVAAAVGSMLAQTFGDFELILLDDGSTDGSKEVLDTFAGDTRVRLFSRPNKGLAATLNEGIGHARGELIARMDGDDLAHPDRLAKQVALMDARPEVVLSGAQIETIDPFGVVLDRPTFPLDHESLERELLNANGWVICHPVSIMRRDALERVGGYRVEKNIVEDLDLFLRLAEVGRLANVPERLLQYRQHLGSVVRTHFDKQLSLREAVIREAYERRGRAVPEPLELCPRTAFTPQEQTRRWAWHALRLGEPAAARGHAKRLLRMQPFSPDAWKVMLCALRGY